MPTGSQSEKKQAAKNATASLTVSTDPPPSAPASPHSATHAIPEIARCQHCHEDKPGSSDKGEERAFRCHF